MPSFTLEQAGVGAVAIEHLAERGHTHVLAVTPPGSQLQALGEQRLAGARAAAERLGVTLTDVPANGLARGLARNRPPSTPSTTRSRSARATRCRPASP